MISLSMAKSIIVGDEFEERWIALGSIKKDKVIVAANIFFDENSKEIIQIINARK